MKFYLIDTKEEKEITVREWNGSGYGPDCFYDLEVNFPEDHKNVDESDAYMCTSEEYEELKEWWAEEVEAMNSGTCAHDMDYSYSWEDLLPEIESGTCAHDMDYSEQHREPEYHIAIFAD